MSTKIFNRYGMDLQAIVDSNLEVLRYYFNSRKNSSSDIVYPEPAVRMLSAIKYKSPSDRPNRREQLQKVQQHG